MTRSQVLRNTSRLRFHRVEYVRRLAAHSVGFLLRQAPKAALPGAVRVVLRQQALAPSEERTQVGFVGQRAVLAEPRVDVHRSCIAMSCCVGCAVNHLR